MLTLYYHRIVAKYNYEEIYIRCTYDLGTNAIKVLYFTSKRISLRNVNLARVTDNYANLAGSRLSCFPALRFYLLLNIVLLKWISITCISPPISS